MKLPLKPAALAAAMTLALASAPAAQTRLTEDALLDLVTAAQSCGPDRTVVAARYKSETDPTILVTCSRVTAFVPLLAGPVATGLSTLLLVGLAAGGSATTPDTK